MAVLVAVLFGDVVLRLLHNRLLPGSAGTAWLRLEASAAALFAALLFVPDRATSWRPPCWWGCSW